MRMLVYFSLLFNCSVRIDKRTIVVIKRSLKTSNEIHGELQKRQKDEKGGGEGKRDTARK